MPMLMQMLKRIYRDLLLFRMPILLTKLLPFRKIQIPQALFKIKRITTPR